MANKPNKKVKEAFTPIFHEVLEGMAYTRLKPSEYVFLFVLWRLSWGNRNKKDQDGQWIKYSNAEFHYRTGLAREVVSRTKAGLLKRRVIKQKKGMIGFNKHFDKWTKQSILTKSSILTKQSIEKYGLNRQQLLTKSSTTIDQTVNTFSPQPSTPAHLQSLKKERKKDIYKEDLIFELFWEKYPKKSDNKKAARKAWDKHIKSVSPEQIMGALKIDMAGVFKDASENKYLPGAGPWLNKERWEDLKPEPVDAGKEELKKQLREVVRRGQQDISYCEWECKAEIERLTHLIRTYKETK